MDIPVPATTLQKIASFINGAVNEIKRGQSAPAISTKTASAISDRLVANGIITESQKSAAVDEVIKQGYEGLPDLIDWVSKQASTATASLGTGETKKASTNTADAEKPSDRAFLRGLGL
jgi:polyhydroxyalkanoate synthesis regulator phasin